VEHEPVGDNDHSGKDAELADRLEVDTEPDEAEECEIGKGREGDGGSDLAEADTDTDRDRVRKRNREDRFCLRVNTISTSEPTKALMFSAPTTTMTNGRVYVGRTVCPVLRPQPFQPRSARTLNDMTVEQQSWTIPVNARPKRECTFVALESW